MSTNNVIDSYVNCAFLDDWITRYGQGYGENLLTNRGWETMEDPATPGRCSSLKRGLSGQSHAQPHQPRLQHQLLGRQRPRPYYRSLGYLKQDGIVIGNDYDRWSFTANGSVQGDEQRYRAQFGQLYLSKVCRPQRKQRYGPRLAHASHHTPVLRGRPSGSGE